MPKYLNHFLANNMIASSEKVIKCFNKSRRIGSFRLTPAGKKYIDQFYIDIYYQLKPKDQEKLSKHPLFTMFQK